MPTESTFDLSGILKEEYTITQSSRIEVLSQFLELGFITHKDFINLLSEHTTIEPLTSLQKEINDLQSMGYRE